MQQQQLRQCVPAAVSLLMHVAQHMKGWALSRVPQAIPTCMPGGRQFSNVCIRWPERVTYYVYSIRHRLFRLYQS
jgi:hypothetical protein